MKRKTIIKGIVFGCLLSSFAFLFLKKEIDVYIGDFSYCNPDFKIDALVKIDGEIIFNDSIERWPFNNKKLIKRLRYGLHTIHVDSEKGNTNTTEKVFLLPNQYIVVEYHPVCLPYNEKAEFSISTSFNPFYYE